MSGYGPMISANRPVRTRMPGGVGAGGRNPPGYPIGKVQIMHLTYLGYYGNFPNMSATVKSKSRKTFPLEIEESLHKALKHKAIESNKSLHAYIIDALVSQVNDESAVYNSDGNVEVKRRKK